MTAPKTELQKHALDYWQIIRNRIGLILLSFIFIFALAAIITYIIPRKYRGKVEMVIERNQEDVRVQGHQIEIGNNYSDSFLKTQFEIISKRKTLDRVVEKLDLMKRWSLPSKQFASGKLLANLDTQASIKSDFITLEYYDEDPKLAAEIANVLAESYRETRFEVDNQRTANGLEQLTSQIAAKELLAQRALDKMFEIKKRLGIVEMPGFANQRSQGADDVNTLDNVPLMDAAHDAYKLKKEIRDMQVQIEQLQKLDGDELIRQAGELRVENDTIRKLGPVYQDFLLKQENLRNTGLGNAHPTMKGLNAEITKTRTLLLDAANDYRSNLTLRTKISEQQLAQMETSNQAQRDKSLNAQVENQEYLKAKKDWDILELELYKLKDTKAQREIDVKMTKTPVTVYQAAEPEARAYKPNVNLNLSLGAIVGLMFGLGLAFFLEYLDTSVKSLDDVERFLGVPVLGVIPKNISLLLHTNGSTPDSEAYRILRTNIEFNRKKAETNCISVVSGSAGEGKSTTMANLATVCAQGGYTTLIVDADMRRPKQHTFFGLPNTSGLSNYLSSDIPIEEVVLRTPVQNLYFVPSGVTPADPAGLLNSKKFSDFIADMKSRFDVVLLDSPPILGVSDASVLAAEADTTLLVIQHRKLPRQMLLRAKQAVEQIGGNIIGAVLNNVDLTSDASYGYYTSYYTYYSADQNSGARTKTRRKKSSFETAESGGSATNTIIAKNVSEEVF